MSRTRFPNAACPLCGKPFRPDADVRSCVACELTYHAGCWSEHGGCKTAECANAPRQRLPEETPNEEGSFTGRREQVDAAPVGARPLSSPSRRAFDPTPQPVDPPASVLPIADKPYPVRAFVVVVVAAVMLTGLLGIVTWQRQKARRTLDAIVASFEAEEDPRKLIGELEKYVRTHADNELTRKARSRLKAARQGLDDFDFRQSLNAGKAAGMDTDAAARAIEQYLKSHPGGAHVDEGKRRLRQIAKDKDDFDYRQARQATAADSQDLDAEKQAMEAYLSAYPEGRHAAEARARLARLPERAAQTRFQEHLRKIDALVAAGQLPDALDQIDAAILETKAASRLDELAHRADKITSALEEIDAQRCRRPVQSGHDRDAQTEACRLFLLCYPDSRHRASVQKRIETIARSIRDEQWRSVESRLVGASFDEALSLLDQYQSSSGDDSSRVRKRVAELYVRRLCRSIERSLAAVHLIRTRDGRLRPGTNIHELGKRILFKSPDGDNLSLDRRDVASVEEPPLRAGAARLSKIVDRMAVRGRIDLRKLETELRNLLQPEIVRYHPLERKALRACLDRVLAASHPRGKTPSGQSQTPPRRDQADDILAFYRRRIESDPSLEKAALGVLPDVYEYHLRDGTTIRVPLIRGVQKPTASVRSETGKSSVFNGHVDLVFKATVSRNPAGGVPRPYHRDIDKLLQSISSKLEVHIDYEIIGRIRRRRDFGIRLKYDSSAIVVAEVPPGSAAEKSDVRAGDRLVRVNGVPVPKGKDLGRVEAMIANAPSEGAHLTLRRAQRRYRVSLDKMEYNVRRFSWRITRRVIPTTAFGAIVQQSEWTPIDPPE